MGRQIRIVMASNDEKIFINQLKNISDFCIIEYFAKSSNELFVDSFNDKCENHWDYHLWDKKIKWEPKFGETKTKEKLIYIENNMEAPLIEFSRQQIFPMPDGHGYGRLYINTFSNENLLYNKNDLINTYNEIIKIIKKTSSGKIKFDKTTVIYFYPESWRNYEQNNK